MRCCQLCQSVRSSIVCLFRNFFVMHIQFCVIIMSGLEKHEGHMIIGYHQDRASRP